MVVTCAILMAAGAARAGYKSFSSGVRMSRNDIDYSGLASGALSHVRASADSTSRIYCYTYPTFGACVAFPNTNTSGISCSTQDPAMLAVMRSVSGDSSVFFQADAQGNCSNLSVTNDSANMPKLN
jgi:hypothetical protein